MIKQKKRWIKNLLTAGLILIFIIGAVVYFIFTEKFDDTKKQVAAFDLNAIELINEFKINEQAANIKYAEKIITVYGKVSQTETADTTVNIKMMDSLTDSYIIFAFQQQHIKEAKQLKEGDIVSIKGSCSGGSYSKILETEYITFKRCAINK